MEYDEAESALREAVRQIRRVRHSEWEGEVIESLSAAEKATLGALSDLNFNHAPSEFEPDPADDAPARVQEERAHQGRIKKRHKKEQRVGKKRR